MKTQPLVTVVTPVYNASRFLPQLIQSVRSQVDVDYEHIIVDDCSTDDSFLMLSKLAEGDNKIKLVKLNLNQGVVKARNAAIAMAKGKYIAFLDADDLWLPNKLKIQTLFMMEAGAVLSFTDYRFVSENGLLIGRRLFGLGKIGWSAHHMTRYIGCSTVMLDYSKIPDFSFGDISSEYRAEDFLAWSYLIKRKHLAIRCPYDLGRYTVVENSRSSNGIAAAKSVWRLYRKVEKIPFVEAGIYFIVYIAFSTAKRFICRPIFPRLSIDQN